MIEHIEIKNFKSIKDLSLNLSPINIIIGSNGVGKSNFISFFELMHNLYEQRLQEYIITRGGIDNFLHFGRRSSKYIAGLLDFDNTNAIYIDLIPSDSEKCVIKETGDFFNYNSDNKKNYSKWNRVSWDRIETESQIKDINDNYRVKYIKEYLESFRVFHFHDTSSKSAIRQLCNVSDVKYLRPNGENLAAYLNFIREKHLQNFSLIEATIRSVAPFFDKFDLAPSKFNEQNIKLEWLSKGNDSYFDANSLSDGTIRFIALTTLFMQDSLPKTIIIDEPELGLHPFAISKLASMIKSAAAKGSQVIVSTQSVELLNHFEPEDIIVADRDENQTTLKRLDTEELSSWLEDYSLGEIWSKNLIGGQPK